MFLNGERFQEINDFLLSTTIGCAKALSLDMNV